MILKRAHEVFITSLLICSCIIASAQQTIWDQTVQDGGCFSSPNVVTDLNGDGVFDIVFGGGTEAQFSFNGITAASGSDGKVLWKHPSRSQIYTSAKVLDANKNGKPDIVIGGRDAQLIVINGQSGKIIWEFWSSVKGNAVDSGWYNFYSPQVIRDVNQDAVDDILISNGGRAGANSQDTFRPTGQLLIISGASGEVLSSIKMPDGRETYFSPIINPLTNEVIFGSGGETKPGSLWRIPLDSLIISSNSARTIITDTVKGFVAVPTFVLSDIYHESYLLVPHMSGKLTALNGKTYAEQWTYQMDKTELYVSPTPGYYYSDSIPDVSVTFSSGVFPFYTSFTNIIIDLITGATLKKWNHNGLYQLTSPNALDIDSDGYDELIYGINRDVGSTTVELRTRMEVQDLNDHNAYYLGSEYTGVQIYSMPLIIDLDFNNKLDLIAVVNGNDENWYQHDSFTIRRIEFDSLYLSSSWPAYMGRDGDGIFHPRPRIPGSVPKTNLMASIYPNPTHDFVHVELANVESDLDIVLYDQLGRAIETWKKSNSNSFSFKAPEQKGLYILRINSKDQKVVERMLVY